MGIVAADSRKPLSAPRVGALFLLLLLGAAAIPAFASVYDYMYSSQTGTVRGLSVSLQGGTAGTATISSVSADAANVGVVAGLVFYENAAPTSSCTSPSSDTALTQPAASSGTISRGQTYCLWSVQFSSASTIYALNWVTDLFVASSKSGYGLNLAMYATDSAGTIQGGAIFTGTSTILAAKNTLTELKNSFAGAAVTVPANGYLEFTIAPPTGGGTPTAWTIYWGTAQLTSFATPSNYNYVLTVSNGAAVAWTVNIGAASSSALGRLANFTVSLTTAPYSQQVVITNGAVSQSSGSAATLPASGTLNIAVGGTANAVPTATNSPSTVTVSLKVLSSTSTVFAQYTIVLNIS